MKKLICLLLALLTVIACVPALAEQESKALVLYFDYSENIDTTRPGCGRHQSSQHGGNPRQG